MPAEGTLLMSPNNWRANWCTEWLMYKNGRGRQTTAESKENSSKRLFQNKEAHRIGIEFPVS